MWNFEFKLGDEVVLSAPENPKNSKEFLAGWVTGMDDFVGNIATIVEIGAKHIRDQKEIATYRVAVDGLSGRFWWDSDYMRRVNPLMDGRNPELEQGFDLVFG